MSTSKDNNIISSRYTYVERTSLDPHHTIDGHKVQQNVRAELHCAGKTTTKPKTLYVGSSWKLAWKQVADFQYVPEQEKWQIDHGKGQWRLLIHAHAGDRIGPLLDKAWRKRQAKEAQAAADAAAAEAKTKASKKLTSSSSTRGPTTSKINQKLNKWLLKNRRPDEFSDDEDEEDVQNPPADSQQEKEATASEDQEREMAMEQAAADRDAASEDEESPAPAPRKKLRRKNQKRRRDWEEEEDEDDDTFSFKPEFTTPKKSSRVVTPRSKAFADDEDDDDEEIPDPLPSTSPRKEAAPAAQSSISSFFQPRLSKSVAKPEFSIPETQSLTSTKLAPPKETVKDTREEEKQNIEEDIYESPAATPTRPSSISKQARQRKTYSSADRALQAASGLPSTKSKWFSTVASRSTPSKQLASSPLRLTMTPVPASRTSPSSASAPASPKYPGLVNFGNSCYWNATLQLLASVPHWAPHKGGAFGSLLVDLLTKLRVEKAQQSSASARALKDALDTRTDKFRGSLQRDAHELLDEVLDQVMEEEAKESKHSTKDQFEWNVRVDLCCTSCQYTRHRKETYRHLSLEIPSDDSRIISVQECFDAFFRPEMVDLHCEQCSEGKQARQSFQIVDPVPKSLILHLKRFVWEGGDHRKNVRPVGLSTQLRVAGHETFGLKSVVHHTGPSTSSGHYTADAMREDKEWWSFDDGAVTPMVKTKVRRETAYLLLYSMEEAIELDAL